MKVISFAVNNQSSFGIVTADGQGVIDAGARLVDQYRDLKAVLEHNALPALAELADNTPDHALADIQYLRPVPYPEKTICVGVNYVNRNEEYRDNADLPKYPSIFMRTPDSLVAHGDTIIRPPESEKLDYEGEIVIVIGKTGRRISEQDAASHIAGLTIMNEGTIRDWLRHGKFNVTQGKNFDRTGAVGPWLVTADEFSGYDDLRVTTRVNDEVRQDDTTASLLFPFRFLIHYISTWTTLKPGDIIATGTPTGAGARFDPPKFLRPGDRIEVEVSSVGCLSNTVVDE